MGLSRMPNPIKMQWLFEGPCWEGVRGCACVVIPTFSQQFLPNTSHAQGYVLSFGWVERGMGRHSHRFQYTWSLLEWYSPAAWSARPGSGVGLESMVTSWRCPQGLGRPGRAAVGGGGRGRLQCSYHVFVIPGDKPSEIHSPLLATNWHALCIWTTQHWVTDVFTVGTGQRKTQR